MNRSIIALIILIIIIIIAALYVITPKNTQTPVNQTGVNGSANNTTNTTNNTVATTIVIQNGAFNPNNITVKTGTNVQWINRDSVAHQVVSDTGDFSSPILITNDVFNFYFAKSGVFGYKCEIHPTETGTITVTP